MTPATPISIKVSAIVHATEDAQRVEQAISGLSKGIANPGLSSTRAKGHYGNQITTLFCMSRVPRVAGRILENIWNSMSLVDRTQILSSLASRTDDGGTLFFRIGKQELVKGNVVLKDSEPVKVEISFRKQEPLQRVIAGIRDALDRLG